MAEVTWTSGQTCPKVSGVYATRIPHDATPTLCQDRFLFWDEDVAQWFHVGSDQRYRGVVVVWAGPLRRKHTMWHLRPTF